MRRALDFGGAWLGISGRLAHGGFDPINRLSANALPLTGKSSPKGATSASFGNAVNNIRFWVNPMMGSAYPADDISHPRYRQIRSFARPGRFLRADDRGAEGRRADPARPRPSPEKTAVLCRQIRGRRTPGRCRGIHHDRPRPRRGPTQVDDDASGRWQGQIPTRQAGHLTLRCPSELSNERHERRRVWRAKTTGPP